MSCFSFLLFAVPYIFRLYESKRAFRAALCDSFNTPEALKVLRDLVSRVNVYLNSRKKLNIALVEQSASWVGQMLRMFGLGEGHQLELGWGSEETEGSGVNVRATLLSLCYTYRYSNSEQTCLCHTSEPFPRLEMASGDWPSPRVMMRSRRYSSSATVFATTIWYLWA